MQKPKECEETVPFHIEFRSNSSVQDTSWSSWELGKSPLVLHPICQILHCCLSSSHSRSDVFPSWNNKDDMVVCLQVTAKGSPDIPLSWAYDLQLGLTRLFGCLCGATLAANPGECQFDR